MTEGYLLGNNEKEEITDSLYRLDGYLSIEKIENI